MRLAVWLVSEQSRRFCGGYVELAWGSFWPTAGVEVQVGVGPQKAQSTRSSRVPDSRRSNWAVITNVCCLAESHRAASRLLRTDEVQRIC